MDDEVDNSPAAVFERAAEYWQGNCKRLQEELDDRAKLNELLSIMVREQAGHAASFSSQLDLAHEQLLKLEKLLREAGENALASTVEEGISDSRREYRVGLVERIEKALGVKLR
jgi:RNA:NAD 2'-phosphotransferase (TPT1/KptA family)